MKIERHPARVRVAFSEARRYYHNAKDTLARAPVKGDLYQDLKPVQEACGTGYLAVLKALNGYLLARGVDVASLPKSIDGYREALRRHRSGNGRLSDALTLVYEILHISGYYRDVHDTVVIKRGFTKARELIDALDRLS